MKISVRCRNGHRLSVGEKYAGQNIRCPECRSVVSVPVPDSDDDGYLDELIEQDRAEVRREAGRQRTDRRKREEVAREASLLQRSRWSSVWGAIGSFLLVFGIGWWLLPSRAASEDEVDQTAAASNPAETHANVNPGRNAHPAGDAANKVSASDATSTRRESMKKGPAPDPNSPTRKVAIRFVEPGQMFGLRRNRDLNVGISYELPEGFQSAAYDSKSGRLAIAYHEKSVVAVYGLEELLAGKEAPLATFQSGGSVVVATKRWDDRSLFVIGGESRSGLQMIDTADLRQVRQADKFFDGVAIEALAGSTNPRDPYVYALTKDKSVRRVSLSDSEVTPIGTGKGPLVVSGDGEYLFGVVPNRQRPEDLPQLLTAAHRDPPVLLSDSGMMIRGNSVSGLQAAPSDAPLGGVSVVARFRSRPIGVGMGNVPPRQRRHRKNSDQPHIVFVSLNTYKRRASIPLPPGWIPASYDRTRDRRLGFTDDVRQCAVVLARERLGVIRLADCRLDRKEPTFRVATPVPPTVRVGQTLSLEFESDHPQATFALAQNLESTGDFGRDLVTARNTGLVSKNDSSGPGTPVLTGKTLTWTPTVEQRGVRHLRVRAVADGTERIFLLAFRVLAPTASIGSPERSRR